jgi:hypothetical protein
MNRQEFERFGKLVRDANIKDGGHVSEERKPRLAVLLGDPARRRPRDGA